MLKTDHFGDATNGELTRLPSNAISTWPKCAAVRLFVLKHTGRIGPWAHSAVIITHWPEKTR